MKFTNDGFVLQNCLRSVEREECLIFCFSLFLVEFMCKGFIVSCFTKIPFISRENLRRKGHGFCKGSCCCKRDDVIELVVVFEDADDNISNDGKFENGNEDAERNAFENGTDKGFERVGGAPFR